ncbi:MGMT family protein [Pseudalkalibacillus caeni]|uniref:MGMT family protein n=1 Tax=Exobacillus caeni TaxID=2574798 RepID=A0A5R9F3B7_9BACL|nr:MGMT family protein [Pseudalkalibacillus caeni]TLS36989.1 MGMT family protein [Pseudalkalibacillus caeni]
MESFTERVVTIIKQIPSGKVMTYGQIAKLAGSPKGARQVVRILHSMSSKHNLPWHRVVNRNGEVALENEELFYVQKMSLESEGVIFKNSNSICLEDYIYQPEIRAE